MKFTIINALETLRPNSQWVLKGDVLEWHDNEQIKPTQKEISAEIKRLEEEYNKKEYQRLRKKEYDKLNQDELRYNDLVNGTNTWQESIKAIKTKYPKPDNV
jgi:hypothetical protein